MEEKRRTCYRSEKVGKGIILWMKGKDEGMRMILWKKGKDEGMRMILWKKRKDEGMILLKKGKDEGMGMILWRREKNMLEDEKEYRKKWNEMMMVRKRRGRNGMK